MWGILVCVVACGDNNDRPGPPDGGLALQAATNVVVSVSSGSTVRIDWTDTNTLELGYRVERSRPGEAEWMEIASFNPNATGADISLVHGGDAEFRVVAFNNEESVASQPVRMLTPLIPDKIKATIDLATNEVTFAAQPYHFALAGAVQVGNGINPGGTRTLELTLTNNANRIVFNPKIVFTAIDDDDANTAEINADGLFKNMPYLHLGNAGLDLAASRSGLISIDTIPDNATKIDLEISVYENPLLMGSNDYYGGNLQLYDAGGTDETTEVDVDQFGYGDGSGYSNPMHGDVSADGRYAYFGLRNQPAIMVLDLVTLTPTVSPSLMSTPIAFNGSGAYGVTRDVKISPDGKHLYVALTENTHMYEGAYEGVNVTIAVVKLDRMTLNEVDRAILLTGINAARIGELSLTADGKRLATPIRTYDSSYGTPTDKVHGKFFVVNTEDMSIIDGDPSPNYQAFSLAAVGPAIDGAAISPDGTRVYASMREGSDDLQVVELSTGAVTAVPTGDFSAGETTDLRFGPDGRLYWSREGELAVLYTQNNILKVIPTTDHEHWSVAFARAAPTYFAFGFNEDVVECFNRNTDVTIQNASTGENTIDTEDIDEGHANVATPF